MRRPYDYIGIRNIFVSQVLTVSMLIFLGPTNMLAAQYDSGGVISRLHVAVWSVAMVAGLCAGGCMILGLSQMRRYSAEFQKAWKIMLLIMLVSAACGGILLTAVLMGPMQARNGLEELEASYRTYTLFGVLLVVAVVLFLAVVALGVLFNKHFLWGCGELSREKGHPWQGAVCKLLFPLGVVTLVGGIGAVVFYYIQTLNSTVDSETMDSARFYLMVAGGFWASTQLLVMLLTWRTWRCCEDSWGE